MDYWRALTQNFGYALQINTLLAKTANKKAWNSCGKYA